MKVQFALMSVVFVIAATPMAHGTCGVNGGGKSVQVAQDRNRPEFATVHDQATGEALYWGLIEAPADPNDSSIWEAFEALLGAYAIAKLTESAECSANLIDFHSIAK